MVVSVQTSFNYFSVSNKPLPDLFLKPGRDKSVRGFHPWVFSGALGGKPQIEDGSLVRVRDHGGNILGTGYYNSKTSIAVRMLNFSKGDPVEALTFNIKGAIALRKRFFNPGITNAYRIINGEGDGIPGLIVDQYGSTLVVQIGTLGVEKLKPRIVEILAEDLSPECIYEKSNLPSRSEEGMQDFEGTLLGELKDPRVILENGLQFVVHFKESQKTGLFLDQREMRVLVGELSAGKRVLNCFSYTGGFSLYAAKAGAQKVDSVDISKPASEQAKHNFEINGFAAGSHDFIAADVFEFLRSDFGPYDFIILDPPAFAKKKSHIENACRGYGEINRIAMQKLTAGGLLLTCSCSYYMDEALFLKVLFQSARDAGKRVRILHGHRRAFDHPVSIYHPEGNYLKSFLLEVE